VDGVECSCSVAAGIYNGLFALLKLTELLFVEMHFLLPALYCAVIALILFDGSLDDDIIILWYEILRMHCPLSSGHRLPVKDSISL